MYNAVVPGRTHAGIMEDPRSPVTVAPPPSFNLRSRPGPVYSVGNGVLQPAFAGMYTCLFEQSSSSVDSRSTFSSLLNGLHDPLCIMPAAATTINSAQSRIQLDTCDRETTTATPGRTFTRNMEASNSPEAVAPFEVTCPGRSSRRSRPGPVFGAEEGVFQPQISGEYPTNSLITCPDDITFSSNSNLRMYYQNVRGLRTKIDDFFLAATDSDYDIIVLTETWLDECINSTQLFGNAYNVFRNDRNPDNSIKSRGGGVLIAVSTRIDCRPEPTPVCTSLEHLWVRLKVENKSLCIGVLYLPPDRSNDTGCIQNHVDSIENIIASLGQRDSIVQFGDYNQPGLTWKITNDQFGLEIDTRRSRVTPAASCLVDGLNLHGLTQINHIKNNNERSLDLIFANDEVLPGCNVLETIEPLINLDPAHPALEVMLEIRMPPVIEETFDPSAYNFRKANYATMEIALSQINWQYLESAPSIDSATEFFTRKINEVIADNVPLRRPARKPPWSNHALRCLKRLKEQAKRRVKIAQSPTIKAQFRVELRQASSRYRSYKRFLYNQYVINVQNGIRRNPKNFWSYVNSKRKNHGLPSTMFLNGDFANTDTEKCNLFATHFKHAFNCNAASNEEVDRATSNTPRGVLDCTLRRVSLEQVAAAIRKLKFSFAAGPDGIPSSLLKRCSSVLLLPLMKLFNISLLQRSCPRNWKKSFMFAVHKKGDKCNIENYRGITSLCACSKVLEIIISDTLFVSCKAHISTDQHGFFPKRSVSTNLVQFVSRCLTAMDSGAQIDAIYTDLKAAFDRVDHAILLRRLLKLGVSADLVEWFRSYLTGRLMCVKIGGSESECFINISGVPQGSNLGPLLFSIFVNEVAYMLTRGCRLLYADDVKIFMEVRSIEDCQELQSLLDRFDGWCTLNLLTLSVSKCNIISFHRKAKPLTFSYTIAGTTLMRVEDVKDLGVLLDRELTFRTHYQDVITRANRQLGFIFKIADDFRDISCLRTLYCSLVRSILEFSSVVWCPFQAVWITRIEGVQRMFTRLAFRRARNPAEFLPYEERCRLLDLEPLGDRRTTAQSLFVARILAGEYDAPFVLSQIQLYVPERNLRQRVFLRLPHRNTDYGIHEPIRFMCSRFNEVADLFDFNVSTELFHQRIRTRFQR